MATVDHTIHGLVTIRLTDAPAAVLQSIERLFGTSSGGDDTNEPDIVVSFTDELETRGPVRLLGLREAAFDSESFYVVDVGGQRSRLDFESLGDAMEIACERGVRSIPLLLPVVGLRLLRKGHVLLHSSAFRYRDQGTLVCGWQKGGKTEMLLAFMAAGAEYVSDEWTILSRDGKTVYGLPSIVQVWSWQLRELPELSSRLTRPERARLAALRGFQRLYPHLRRVHNASGFPADVLQRLSLDGGNALVGQVRAPPERLFGDRIRRAPMPLDRVFLATSSESGTSLRGISSADVSERAAASLSWERRRLLTAYDQFRFAFPDRRSSWLEQASDEEQALLSDALRPHPAHEVTHPYPVRLKELFDAAAPLYAS
jgi:hypothetical protein